MSVLAFNPNPIIYRPEADPQEAAQDKLLATIELNQATEVTVTDLNNKVDKVAGKGLSSNDYTGPEKTKLANLATVASTGSYSDILNLPVIPSTASQVGAVDFVTYTNNRAADLATLYTQAQVNTILQGYYKPVTVASYVLYQAQCTGPQLKLITVTADSSDGGNRNKYFYEGDNVISQDPLF